MNSQTLHIKNLLMTLTLLLILLIGIAVDFAQASQGVINYDVVNIRSGPGTSYAIAGTALKNSQITILQTQGDWKQVSLGKVAGWIAAQYIDAAGIGEIVITGDWANIRSGPGTNYTSVGKANKGEAFTLLSQEGEWYHILTSAGQEAYLAGYLAQVSPAGQTGETAEITKLASSSVNSGENSDQSGKNLSVILNGTAMSFEVPPIVENGRTLVPMRPIFEAMGAQVEWNAGTKTVIARKNADVVVLPLNSIKPTINGKAYTLEVPAKIINSRTLAPLRFVAEAFGGQVDWNESTRTVKITSFASNGTMSGNTAASTGNPIVVTAKVSDVCLREQPTGAASALSVAQPGEKLTVLTERDGWYQVSRGSNTGWVASWMVEASSAGDATAPSSGSGTTVTSTQGTTINANEDANTIHISKTSDSKGIKITLTSNESFKPNIKQTSGVIQYDLGEAPVASFSSLDETIDEGKLTIRKTTVVDSNLITITLPSWVQYELASEGASKYIVTIPNCITSIEKAVFGSVGDRIIIHTITPISGQTGTLNGSTLEVKLPGTAMKEGYSFSGSGTLFSSIGIAENGSDVLFTINTNNLGKFTLPASGKKELNIILMKKTAANTGERIVVLDPGHGGKDCGSSGTTLKEKDVNLAVALKTGTILQQKGIKVEYTRTDDSFMEVSEESGIGNDINATVFVAFHCNSSYNIGPSGTETYFYAPLEIPELYAQREERSRLANLIQSKMIANLNLVNRGVKDNQPYWVLKYTTMPSAIVEMGFINNPEEEKLLGQEGIQDLAAQAISDAIQEYLQSL